MAPGFLKQILLITGFRLLLNTGRRFVYPFAPELSRSLDVPLTAITTIIATGQFTSLLGIFAGPLADRNGYRMMMRSGLAVLALGMLICGLFPAYWPVFAGLVVASFGKTLFDPAIQAFVGNHVPFAKRGRVVGLIETAWAGSTLIGIPALALIIDHVGLSNSFYLVAVLAGISWFVMGVVIQKDSGLPATNRQKISFWSSMKQLMRVRAAAGMLVFGFWISVANDALFVVYGAWFEHAFAVSIVTLGFSTVAIGSAELLGESMTALFSDKIGQKRAVIIGLLLSTIAYSLLPFLGFNLGMALFGLFLVFISFEFTIVSSFSLVTEVMPEARATVTAGYYAISGIGRMIGVLVAGFMWNWGGIHGIATMSALFTVFGLLSLLWGLHGWSPQASRESERRPG